MNRRPDFDEVFKQYQPNILGYISKMTGPDLAEDITQEVFEKVSRNLDGFKGESKLSTWIYRIATNTALDRIRSPSFKLTDLRDTGGISADEEPGHPISGEAPASPEQQVIRKEMGDCIHEFIGRLPPDYRTVLALSEIQGMKNREIAEILEISLDSVKIRLHRARARLRQELESGCVFYRDDRNVFSCDRKTSGSKPQDSD